MSQLKVEPYLYFNGNCEEALAFYGQAIGAKVLFSMRFNESPEPQEAMGIPPGFDNKIMHATIQIGSTQLMASDGCEPDAKPAGFSLALNTPSEEEARKAFEALSQGGQVTMPLMKTFWSPCFGMLTDRFGMSWMVSVYDEQAM